MNGPRTGRDRQPIGIGTACRACLWLTLASVLVSASGCSPIFWQKYKDSPSNPAVWMRSMFPPNGESFYTDRAHEIERSLNRHRPDGATSLD